MSARNFRAVVLIALGVAVILMTSEGGVAGMVRQNKEPAASTTRKAPLTVLTKSPPVYPQEAQLKNYAGRVTVCFTVTVQGKAIDLKREEFPNLVAPPGVHAPESATTRAAEARTLLGNAAMAAIRKWRFSPRRLHGKAVATPDVCQDIRFNLSMGSSKAQIKAIQKAAAAGSAMAQFGLAYHYVSGIGVKQDLAKAEMWALKSSEQGSAYGQALLGEIYSGAFGSRPHIDKALKWGRKSAKQGNALGELMLGLLYKRGEGVARDPVQAVHWFRKSAEQGNMIAEAKLGYMYAHGEGLTKNCGLAFYWYTKAAKQGLLYAQDALEAFAKKGDVCHISPT